MALANTGSRNCNGVVEIVEISVVILETEAMATMRRDAAGVRDEDETRDNSPRARHSLLARLMI